MEILTPHLAFDPSETAQSFASRLAAFHTGGRPEAFLRDFGIARIALDTGKAEAIRALAVLSGVDEEALIRNTPVHTDRTTFALRGHTLAADFFVRPRMAYCPACVRADDLAPGDATVNRKQRWTWALEVVRTCPEHGLPLVRREKPGADELVDLVVGAPRAPEAIQTQIAAGKARTESTLQAYSVARLDGHSGPAWLDAQPLDDVVRASELLGAVQLFGTRVDLAGLNDDKRDRAGECGFAIMARGEDAVRNALAELRLGFRNNGSKPGAQTVFGTLFKRVAARRGRSYGRLKPILRAFIVETFALEAGTVVLGERLEQRRLHTALSLAAEQALDHRTLRHLLVSRRLLAEEAQPHQAFDAAEGRAVARTVRHKVTVTGLPKALGCSRPMADQILAEGILGPLADGNPHGKGHARKAVFKDDVDALIARIDQAVTEVVPTDDGCVPIAKAAEKVKRPAIDILHLILGGYLEHVMRVEGQSDLAGIRVDADEVGRAMSRIAIGMSPTETFQSLRIPISSGWALVERSVLPVEEIETPNGKHVVCRFRKADVERFASDLTTGARLGELADIAGPLIERTLRHARIRPVFSRHDVGINLFRTVDVESIVFK